MNNVKFFENEKGNLDILIATLKMSPNNNIFGSPKDFPLITNLLVLFEQLPKNQHAYISNFINKFNNRLNRTFLIENIEFSIYILSLLKDNYLEQLKTLKNKNYSKEFLNLLRNYMLAKIKNFTKLMNFKKKIEEISKNQNKKSKN